MQMKSYRSNARTYILGSVRVLGAVLLATQVVACATTISVPRMKPAEINLSAYSRIAVANVRGQGGNEMSGELTAALFATKRFEVLDRKNMGAIIKEQDLGASGAISEESAAAIGQLIGSAALVLGDVTEYSYNETNDHENTTCSDSYQDHAGKTKYKNVPCVKYTRAAKAVVSATFNVVDTTSGKILATKSVTANRHRSVTKRDDHPPAINARSQWLRECRAELIGKFMKVIAPYKINVQVKLLDDGDLPSLEAGNNFAKIGNWNKAIELYRKALGAAKTNPDIGPGDKAKAHYNLGVGLGYSGQYDAGIAELETAYSLEPDNNTMSEISKIRDFKADDARLKAQQAAPAESSQG